MSTSNLIAYLQEHAAGASAALDLLHHLTDSHSDSADSAFFAQLRDEIVQDKVVLDEILASFSADESGLLNALTRVGEKFARAKFLVAGPGHGDLGRLEALEMLSLGIEGKRSLWLALQSAAVPLPAGVDLTQLLHRAGEQRAQVEERRLRAAAGALAAGA